ncbi:hypothetical protein [Desulfonauticus submarinus]
MRKKIILFLTGIFFIANSVAYSVGFVASTQGAGQQNNSHLPLKTWPYPGSVRSWAPARSTAAQSSATQSQLPANQQVTIQGTITSFTPPVATVRTANGEVYLRVGPWWFWQQRGYLNAGEPVEVQGYLWGSYLLPTTIKTSKQTITLRDQYGFPVWRGGWGPGRGWGRGRCWW